MTGTFLLDARGIIHGANRTAETFCPGPLAAQLGQPFVTLFAFDVVSDDPDLLETQWEVLAATATEQRVPLRLRHADDEPAVDVRVELEAAAGENVTWLARVSLAPRDSAPPLAFADSAPAAPAGSSASAPTAAGPGATGSAAPWPHLINSDAAGFFDLNFAADETHYSPAWKRLLGYADADLANTYETWLKLIHPDDSAAAPDQIGRHTRSTRRTFSVEFRMKHRRGHWVWIHSVGVQLFADDGELQRVVGFHLDISERKEIEEQGVEAENRLAALGEEGGLAIFDLDFCTGRAWASQAWRDLIGDPVEHPDIGSFTRYLADCAGDLTHYLAHFGSDGQWGAGYATLRRSDRGEFTAVLGLQRHVSRRGELLRIVGCALPAPANKPPGRSTAPFAPAPTAAAAADTSPAVLNALQEAVILTDEHGSIRLMNTKAEHFTGLPNAVAAGRPLADVFRLLNATDRQPNPEAIDLALEAEGGPRLNSDHLLAVEGLPPRELTWSVHQLRGNDDRIQGVAVVFRDPNEMSLTPEELIRANRFDSLGHLAGGIAHDFNNLLSTILGAISIAKDNRDYEMLGDAETACMTAKTLTRQLLSFAKGNPGGTYTVTRPTDILRDAVRVAAAGSPVKIHLDLDERTSPIEVDRGQMIQVFQNLIINAMQAMAEPSRGQIWIRCRTITLEAGRVPPLEAGDYVQIEVQDNGSGIPDDKIDRIFEPFFTTKKTGTGLGLATVLSIIRKHGGQLGVDSTVGVGTTFTTFLPTTDKSLETGVRKPATLRYGTGRVLFMDDDEHLCAISKTMLESLDYKVDIARHGEEALALYRRYHAVNRPYDVVLLDLTIVGGMGGEETFKKLKEIDPDVRAIVSSGYDSDEMARDFLESGFCGYLTKPYRIGELGKMLKTVLGG